MFDKLNQIKSILGAKKKINRKAQDVTKPLLTDLSLLPFLYKLYNDYLDSQSIPTGKKNIVLRQRFIFLTMYFYSPETLVGGRSPKGLRSEIAKVIDVKSQNLISYYLEDITFRYSYYKDYRESVEGAYKYMSSALAKMSIITL